MDLPAGWDPYEELELPSDAATEQVLSMPASRKARALHESPTNLSRILLTCKNAQPCARCSRVSRST